MFAWFPWVLSFALVASSVLGAALVLGLCRVAGEADDRIERLMAEYHEGGSE